MLVYTLLSLAGSTASYANTEQHPAEQKASIGYYHALIHAEPELGNILQAHLFYTSQPAKKLSGSSALTLSDTCITAKFKYFQGAHKKPVVFCKAYLNHIYPTHNFW